MENYVIIEKDELIIDLKAMLQNKEESPLSTSHCICRVPDTIREHNAQAYTPKVVSIGPFHRDNPRLQKMETRKQVYFKQFIDEAADDTILYNLASFGKASESRVRVCYSEYIKLSEKELVTVILVDAIFIIKLFMIYFELPFDASLGNPWMLENIKMDLLLLENQLPFFILEELYDVALPPETRDELPSFRELTFFFFSDLNRNHWRDDSNVSIKHFTDLLRTFYFDPNTKKSDREEFNYTGSNNIVYSARELYDAGLELKMPKKRKSLLNLEFSRNTLEIPEILVDDGFEILLRNMIALEQCHYPYEAYITHYAYVLASLINKSQDVDVLVHNRIIANCLANSDDVVQLFNGLCKDLTIPNFSSDYFKICQKLNAFYKHPWNNLKATLRSKYGQIQIGGVLIIILTIVQTIFSIIH